MARIKNLNSLLNKLRAKTAHGKQSEGTVVVGFTQTYAVYVHENLEAQHAQGKQAKYLETPAREMNNNGTFSSLIREALVKGKTLLQALLLCGLRLQREAQQIVPVATGALKGSAFTRIEQS